MPQQSWRLQRKLAFCIAGDRIAITGASRGIGRELARKLGRAGGTLALVARRKAELDEVAAEVEALGGRAHPYPADLSRLDQVQELSQEMLGELGGVDLLVNNAAQSVRRPVAQACDRLYDFRRLVELNYLGALALILTVLPGMLKSHRGHIINVSSMGTQTHTPHFSAYNASKAALYAWSRTAAGELASQGIRLSTVYMPLVRTDMLAPTTAYSGACLPTAGQGADLISHAIVSKKPRVGPRLGALVEVISLLAPRSFEQGHGVFYRRGLTPEIMFGPRGAARR